METATLMPLNLIRTDLGTQMRVMERSQTIDQYVESMELGCQFPPITVFTDGQEYWLADGFHRLAAFRKRGRDKIPCFLKEGTFDDAREFACCANQDHGLPRSPADKRKAVEQFFAIPGRDALTNSEVARRLGVTTPFVKNVRDGLGVKASPASHVGAGSVKRGLNGLNNPASGGKELNGLNNSTSENEVKTVSVDLPKNDKRGFAIALMEYFDAEYLKTCAKYLTEAL